MPKEDMKFMSNSKLMTADEIISISKVFVSHGVDKIRLTGGEPLIRADFDYILSQLHKLPVSLHLTTNGITLHKHIDHIVDCGIKDINISLDTLNMSKFSAITRRDSGHIVLNNIKLAIEKGLNVKINTVLLKDLNENEILDLIELGKDFPISVRFIEFMPFDKNDWEFDKAILLKDILELTANKYPNLKSISDHKNSTSKNFKIPGFKGDFGVISTVSTPFCTSCNRIRLTADGKIKNCLFESNELDLLTALRKKEDLNLVIHQSLKNKKASRGGMDTQKQFKEKGRTHINRSMIGIGG